jgi:hypothetical protein
MNCSRIEKDTLSCRGFAGIDVRGDSDVPRPFQWERTLFCIDRRNFRFVSDNCDFRDSGHGLK